MLADKITETTALINVLVWPFVAIVALILYRRQLSQFLVKAGGRISRVSFGGASVEFVPASEAPASAVSAVTEFIDASSAASGVGSDSGPSLQLAIHSTGADFVKLNLRSGRSWLTSRLYIFSVIFSETAHVKKIVFVQTNDVGVETFVGLANPLAIADKLGDKFRWFCYALANAEREAATLQPFGPQPFNSIGEVRPFTNLEFASRVAEKYLIHPLIRNAAHAGEARRAASKFVYIGDGVLIPQPAAPGPDIPPPSGTLPTINGVVPPTGPASGGTLVNITGDGFGGLKEVRFGDVLAAVSSVNGQQILAISPPGHGDVAIKIRTSAGSSETSDDWVTISSSGSAHDEHAAWIRDGRHLRSILGDALDTSCITDAPSTKTGELRNGILQMPGDFVAIVGSDRQFIRLIDRRATVERLIKDLRDKDSVS